MREAAIHYEQSRQRDLTRAGRTQLNRPATGRSCPRRSHRSHPFGSTASSNRCCRRRTARSDALDGSVLTLPNPDLFVLMYVRKEAVLSSQIEGTQSSLQDLLAAEAQLSDQTRPGDVDEVINYVRAMNTGLDRLADLPVSVRLIREIQPSSCAASRGGRLQPGRVASVPELDWPGGLELGTASVRSDRHLIWCRRRWRSGAVPALVRRLATAREDRTGTRAVRNDPPVPRRQRTRGRLLITFLLD